MQKKKQGGKLKGKKPPTHFSPETWGTIATLYSSGTFGSIGALYQHCTKIINPCPSLSSIRKYVHENGLSKRTLAGVIEERKRERFIDYFTQLGADDKKCAELIVSGMQSASELRPGIFADIEKMKAAAKEQKIEMYVMALLDAEAKLQRYFANMGIALKYAQERFKLCGDYQAVKIKKMGAHEGGERGSVNDDDCETIEEIEKELERLERNRLL
jgi:hypothetical protein